MGVGIVRAFPHTAHTLEVDQLHVQHRSQLCDDLVLYRVEIMQRAIETISPEVGTRFGRAELCVHAQTIAQLSDASLQDITDAEVLADPLHVRSLALVRVSRAARYDQRARQLRKIGGQVIRYAVREIFLLLIATPVVKRQHHKRQAWCVPQAQVRQ